MSIFVNQNGKKKVTGMFANVNGEKKKILSAWVNKDGVATKVWGASGGSGNVITGILMVGYDKAYFSKNGKSYVAMTGLDTSIDHESAGYGNGRFVTISIHGKAYYSDDGITWIYATTLNQSYEYHSRIAYGNGVFVIPHSSGKLGYYSNDGIAWTSITIGGSGIRGLEFCCDRFIAVGYSCAYYSFDGISWVKINGLPTGKQYRAVTYFKGKYIVGGDSCVYCSSDLSTWTSGNLNIQCREFACNDEVIVAVDGQNKKIYYSTDGIRWTLARTNTMGNSYSTVYANNMFICMDGNILITSDDGKIWNTVSGTTFEFSYVSRIVYGEIIV